MYRPGVVDLPGERTAIVVVPGYGGGPLGYNPLLQGLNGLGHRVVFVPSLRTGGSKAVTPLTRAKCLAVQANNVLRAAEELGLETAILFGHSWGSPIATACGALAPRRFPRIINLCPAGAYPNNPWQVAAGMARKQNDEHLRLAALSPTLRVAAEAAKKEAVRYFWANPWRSLAEAWCVSQIGPTPVVMALEYGLDAYYLGGQCDALFRDARIEQQVKATFGNGDRFVSVYCGHDPQNKLGETAIVVAALVQHNLLTLP